MQPWTVRQAVAVMGASCFSTNSVAVAAKVREIAHRKQRASVFTYANRWLLGVGSGGDYRGETKGPRFCITVEACQSGKHPSSGLGS